MRANIVPIGKNLRQTIQIFKSKHTLESQRVLMVLKVSLWVLQKFSGVLRNLSVLRGISESLVVLMSLGVLMNLKKSLGVLRIPHGS